MNLIFGHRVNEVLSLLSFVVVVGVKVVTLSVSGMVNMQHYTMNEQWAIHTVLFLYYHWRATHFY